jgi:CheY-like chemotaxis protein
VALTAGAYAADRRRCAECGMNDFLAKPVKLDELAVSLMQWLKWEAPWDPPSDRDQ